MTQPFVVEPARPDEREAAFFLIFHHNQDEERELRVANALGLVAEGDLDPAGLLVARTPRGIVGAMLCLPVAGASGLVWPPQALDVPDWQKIEDALVRHGSAWLRQRGAKLAQAMLPKEDRELARSLVRNGFDAITSLAFLRHDLELIPALPPRALRLDCQSYRHGDQGLFHQTLMRSYDGTLDCPEVNGVRELAEILEGHRAQGAYDPERWWLAKHDGRPVAVLLLMEMPASRCWDLSYLGVVPEARRTGVGRELTVLALREAKASGVSHLTLSVDERNDPAWALYTGLGFEPFDRRDVYLSVWHNDPTKRPT